MYYNFPQTYGKHAQILNPQRYILSIILGDSIVVSVMYKDQCTYYTYTFRKLNNNYLITYN